VNVLGTPLLLENVIGLKTQEKGKRRIHPLQMVRAAIPRLIKFPHPLFINC
jgi:hypothetical protein